MCLKSYFFCFISYFVIYLLFLFIYFIFHLTFHDFFSADFTSKDVIECYKYDLKDEITDELECKMLIQILDDDRLILIDFYIQRNVKDGKNRKNEVSHETGNKLKDGKWYSSFFPTNLCIFRPINDTRFIQMVDVCNVGVTQKKPRNKIFHQFWTSLM